MCSEYSRCSKLLFFIFTNLLQIEEKTHIPVTVCFPDYAFNENMHMYCFHEWDVFLIYLFLWQTQKLINKCLVNLEERKKLFLHAQFLVKFVMLPAQSHWQIDFLACLPAQARSCRSHIGMCVCVCVYVCVYIYIYIHIRKLMFIFIH